MNQDERRIFELQERILELKHEFRFNDIRGVEIRKEVLVSLPKSFYENFPLTDDDKPFQRFEPVRTYSYFVYLDPGFYENARFLKILRKHGFDIGHIIFHGQNDKLIIQLVDMNEGLT